MNKVLGLVVLLTLLAGVVPSAYGVPGISAGTTVSTTSVQLLAANSLRGKVICVNNGAVNAFVAFGTTNAATTTNGFLLGANGGSMVFPDGRENPPLTDIAAITASGSTTVTCVELIK